MKKLISTIIICCMTLALCACGHTTNEKSSIDYMALVNKLNPLPKGWEKALKTTTMTNSIGDKVEVEKKAYDAYLKLKAELEKEGIYVDLDSARRSVKDQKRIMNDFIKEYGEDYAKKTVAKPGYSEHHTGLALDLYLIINGKDVTENEDMIKYTDIWSKIHKKLPKYGFILRYLKGKEHITGYGYEPWHIRYIDSASVANKITHTGQTLEAYLGKAKDTNVKINYAKSNVFKKSDLEEAVIQIKCDFASLKGYELHSIKYIGDKLNSKKQAIKNKGESSKNKLSDVAIFTGSFHTPKNDSGKLKSDTEYKHYEWWLSRTEDDGWEIIKKIY